MAELIAIDVEPADASVVTYLESLLQRARDGEFSAIAVAYVYRDGRTGSGFSNQHKLASMVGSVEALSAKLVRDMLGDDS